MWDEFKNIKSGKKELREFGLTVGAILVILGGAALWLNKNIYPYLLGFGLPLIILGLAKPGLLKPLQKMWMGFSIIVGFFMSRLILMLLFYIILTPIGLIMKMLGKDILDQKICRSKASYWIERSGGDKTKESYENQF